jgi:hypothetical protein
MLKSNRKKQLNFSLLKANTIRWHYNFAYIEDSKSNNSISNWNKKAEIEESKQRKSR